MFGFRKIMARDARQRREGESDTEVDSAPRGHNLEAEYEALITTQCVRWGIDEKSITLEVRRLGRTNSGLDIYGCMMRLTRWQRDSALRVLLGLPLLEAKIRKMVRSLWLGEVSHFGGLWLHASEQLTSTEAMAELRLLILQLTHDPEPAGGVPSEPFSSVLGTLGPADEPPAR
ncbi:hypothetical protein LZ009_09900 [Ramlibacter sp. XY19]|uniref:hypothetical protein n=1 Tax=Ramlibacter paludis TaxID=2908000 RepID=UPI0023DC4F60|nr:hypothetical protein [Ramlibacter paludis]MCG2593093.1 hypothetical protein [Ramlibacter paludis]